MSRQKKKFDAIIEDISAISAAANVLRAMQSRKNYSNAVFEAGVRRQVVDDCCDALEKHFGVEFFVKPTGNAQLLTSDHETRGLIADFVQCAERLRLIQDEVRNLGSRYLPELRIGTWASIGRYAIPALVRQLRIGFGKQFDVKISSGESFKHLLDVQSRQIDFAILPSKDERADELGVFEIGLDYERGVEGITFLYKRAGKPGPFPDLANFVDNPKSLTSELFLQALNRSPIVIMDTEDRHGQEDFEKAVGETFSRKSKKPHGAVRGPRYEVPTYFHERQLVARGVAVGFGYPPKSVKRNISTHLCKIVVGTDPGYPGVFLAHFGLEAIVDTLSTFTPFDRQTFSIYVRRGYEEDLAQGGVSPLCRAAIDCFKAICKGKCSKEDCLKFRGGKNDRRLVHDYS